MSDGRLGNIVYGSCFGKAACFLEWVTFTTPEDLPHPGTEPGSPALQADSLPSEPPGSPTADCRGLLMTVALEKGTASHSSILVWRTPWTEEPGGLQSTGSQSWTRLE